MKNRVKQNLETEAENLRLKLVYGKDKSDPKEDCSKPIYEKYKQLYSKKRVDENLFEKGVEDCKL